MPDLEDIYIVNKTCCHHAAFGFSLGIRCKQEVNLPPGEAKHD